MARELSPQIEQNRRLPDELGVRRAALGRIVPGRGARVGGRAGGRPGAHPPVRRNRRSGRRLGGLVRIDSRHEQPARRVAGARGARGGVRESRRGGRRRVGAPRPRRTRSRRLSGLRAVGVLQRHRTFRPHVRRLPGGRGRRSTHASRAMGLPVSPSSRSSTPGTRVGCAAPGVMTSWPVTSSSPNTAACGCSIRRHPKGRCTAFRSSPTSRCRSPPPRWATRGARSRS